jgi:hypothetical protein
VGFFGSQASPGEPGKHNSDNEEQEERETPQFGLALLEFFQASFCPGAGISLRRGPGIAGRIVLAVHEFSQTTGTWLSSLISLIHHKNRLLCSARLDAQEAT